jgi:hypothetical protein
VQICKEVGTMRNFSFAMKPLLPRVMKAKHTVPPVNAGPRNRAKSEQSQKKDIEAINTGRKELSAESTPNELSQSRSKEFAMPRSGWCVRQLDDQIIGSDADKVFERDLESRDCKVMNHTTFE